MIRALFSIPIYMIALCTFVIMGVLFIVFSFIFSTNLMYKSSRMLCWVALKSFFIQTKIVGDAPPRPDQSSTTTEAACRGRADR